MSPDGSERTGRLALDSRRALDRAIDDLGRDLDPLGHSPPRGPGPESNSSDPSDVGKLMAIAARLQMVPASTWDELAPLFTGNEPDMPSSSVRTRSRPGEFDVRQQGRDARSATGSP